MPDLKVSQGQAYILDLNLFLHGNSNRYCCVGIITIEIARGKIVNRLKKQVAAGGFEIAFTQTGDYNS